MIQIRWSWAVTLVLGISPGAFAATAMDALTTQAGAQAVSSEVPAVGPAVALPVQTPPQAPQAAQAQAPALPKVDFPLAWLGDVANAAKRAGGALERRDGNSTYRVELAGDVLTFTGTVGSSYPGFPPVASERISIQVTTGQILEAQSNPLLQENHMEPMSPAEALSAAGNDVGTWKLHLPHRWW